MNNYNWDLSELYEGYETDKYKNDVLELDKNIEELNKLAAGLNHNDEVKALENYLKCEEKIKK